MRKTIMTILIIIFAIGLVIFIGLQIKPASFAPITSQANDPGSFPLPEDLPSPVIRFYKQIYGDQIPIVESAVISGRAKMVFNGIKLPARFRFTHIAGQDYHHNIELAFFGFPILKADESYINGNSRMVLPFGTIEGEPKVNQAANLGLWAETIWFPAVFLSDSRVTWEAVDEDTALLKVPFEDKMETFTVEFDAETGLVSSLQAMRYKEVDSPEKILWTNDTVEWDNFNGQTALKVGAVTWEDMGKPWAVFSVEEIKLNVDTSFAIAK